MYKKKIWFAALSLASVHVLVLGAGFFAPYDPAEQHRDAPFERPMRLHIFDSHGRFHLRPYVCTWVNEGNSLGPPRYAEDCSHTWPLRFLVREETHAPRAALGPARHLLGVDAPGRVFLLGTDDYGRDQLSRLLYGGQVSLFAGLLATGLSLGLGAILGCIAGYFGSWPDDVIMRVAEIFMALPWIYLLFALRAFLPLNLGAGQPFFLLISVIGLAGWARPSRLVRGVVLSAKQRDFVHAARGFGASNVYILRRHILPEIMGVVLTQAALLISQCILAEITLSFLGLGLGEPAPSWGNMLAGLQKYYVLENCWWMLVSGLALVPVFLLYHLLADALCAHFKAPGLSRKGRMTIEKLQVAI
ncbi:MAG TPA: ABC transporter permease [Candidatus Saccharimonadales bacterium]|nr:ABC transporter permease [Candidatus Saccharimonadales bacterium]